MTTCNRVILRTVAGLLASLSSYVGIAQASERAATTITSRPGGFITPSDRRAPGPYAGSGVGYLEGLCAVAKRRAGWNCPPSLRAPAGSSDTLTADLPHLRLNMVFRELRNVLVTGSGVGNTPYAKINIESTGVDASIAEEADLLLPGPGDIWDVTQFAIAPLKAIIKNGCMGAAASFDLTLDGELYLLDQSLDVPIADFHLADTVHGHGYYNFKFTVRATDESGNQSDLIFSGDADSFCTGSLDISN